MYGISPAPSVVVGIDGSRGATHAALWAVDEAIRRDTPLRLVYILDPARPSAADTDRTQFAAARSALAHAQRSIEATGKRVKIESEVLQGKPLAVLLEQSRSAAMVCVGSIGLKHACYGVGSVAAALPGWAHCPVAVILPHKQLPATPDEGSIVVEADNDVMLRHAFEEASLRGAPVRVVSLARTAAPDGVAYGNRLGQAQLNRRIAQWTRRYPDVQVEVAVARGSICQYLTTNADSVRLFVADARTSHDVFRTGHLPCSMLTVRSYNVPH